MGGVVDKSNYKINKDRQGSVKEEFGDFDPPATSSGHAASVEDIVIFVKNLCLTFSHLTLYPPAHPLVVKQISLAWEALKPIFNKYGGLNVSLTEGRLLFFGMPVEEHNPVVAKFSRHFESLHIHSITFKKDIEFLEFELFFRIFSQDHLTIEEQGGIEKLLSENNIKHISFNTAVYKVISEDEKIVKKTDLYKGVLQSEEESRAQLLSYFVGKMLDHAQDEKQLLDEIKNAPEELASQIVRVIEEIGSGGKYDRDSMVEALLQNIRMVADVMAGAEKSETTDNKKETVASAMLVLENELKRKSKGMSSASAIRFIKRITDVISSYTEKVKAEKILDEFLKHEKSLKSAERLMKELDISGESGRKILERIRELMKERNISADELVQQIDETLQKKEVKKKRRKEYHSAFERIKQKLDKYIANIPDKDALLDYIGKTCEQEISKIVSEKTNELQKRAEKAEKTVSEFKHIFNNTNIGVVVVDENGLISISEHGDRLPYKIESGLSLPSELVKEIAEKASTCPFQLGECTVWQVSFEQNVKLKSILFQF